MMHLKTGNDKPKPEGNDAPQAGNDKTPSQRETMHLKLHI